MGTGMQKAMALAGPIFALIMLGSFWLMGFIPPLSPAMSDLEVASAFESHRTGIRVGAMLSMQFCVFGLLWTVAIAGQIRRIESSPPVLTYAQLVLGVFTFVVFILACLMWTVAAFRPERDPQLLLLLNDLGWLGLLMPVGSGVLQAILIGVAVFMDPRDVPLFPRWAGYFNFWCALLFIPGALATFFKTGPFAWNGLFDFWLPVPVFIAWMIVNAVLVTKAADRP